MNAQKGFTLIELMIVVAIIGILAAIAIPAYQNYIARSQMTEAMSLSSAQKAAVAEYYGDKGSFPKDNVEAGIALATDIKGKYVKQVNVNENGVIVATMQKTGISKSIQDKTLTLTPKANPGSIEWSCTSDAEQKFLPTSCKGV